MRRPVNVIPDHPWWMDALAASLAVLPMVAGLLVLLFLGGCGDNVTCPELGAPPPLCTDVVIWGSPASDCTATGGRYERKVWPLVSGTPQDVCDFCEVTP